MIVKPLGFYTYGGEFVADTQQSTFDGFRILSRFGNFPSPQQDFYSALSTTQWMINPESEGDPSHQRGTPADDNSLDRPWAIMGMTDSLGMLVGNLNNDDPAWWCGNDWDSDNEFYTIINGLQFNQGQGIYYDPNTTDRDTVVMNMQKGGFWFWRPGNEPPLTRTCLLSYEFDTEDCWEGSGASEVYDLSGNGNTGTINGTSYPDYDSFPADAVNPWSARFPFDATRRIVVANNITSTDDAVTYEYLGAVASNSTYQYIFQTSNSVYWRARENTNYWDFSSQNTSTSPDPSLMSHAVLAIDAQVNTSQLYVGNYSSWSLRTSAGANNSIYGKVGAGFTIGGLYTGGGSNNFDGGMNMFRIWDGRCSSTEAEILFTHSKYKTGW